MFEFNNTTIILMVLLIIIYFTFVIKEVSMMTDKNDNWYGWNYVTKTDLQEKGMLPGYKV